MLAYAPLSQGFLTGRIKSFEDFPENDMRRMFPRFQPDVFDENMKLVEAVRKIAESKECSVRLRSTKARGFREANRYNSWLKSPLDG